MTETNSQSYPAARPPVLTRNFIFLFLGFHQYMLTLSMFNLLPHYLDLRGASEGLYGAIGGTTGIASFVCIIFLGGTADKWSRRGTTLFYLSIAMAGNLISIWAMNYALEWYFLPRVLHGLMMGMGFPIVLAWAVEISPIERRQEALAWIGMGGLLANSTGPLIAEFILSVQGMPVIAESYRWVFLASTLLMLVAMGWLFLIKNTRAPKAKEGEEFKGLLPMFKPKGALVTWLTAVTFGGVFGVSMVFGKTYTESVGLHFVSVLFVAHTVGSVISRSFIGYLSRRYTQPTIISGALAGVGVSVLLLGITDTYLLLGISGFIYGAAHGLLYPTLIMQFIHVQDESSMGRAAILFQGGFASGIGLFPYLGGFLVEQTSFTVLFTVLGLFTLCTIPLAWVGNKN